MSLVEFIEETIEIVCLESDPKIEMTKEQREEMAGAIETTVECYNEVGRGPPPPNPMEAEVRHQKAARDSDNREWEQRERDWLAERQRLHSTIDNLRYDLSEARRNAD